MNPEACNAERLGIYTDVFTWLIRGWGDDAESESVMVNLLVNTQWPEVARAFVDCVGREGAAGEIRPLARDVERLVGKAATVAFGTSCHSQIPSWFLKNYECFLACSLHRLLLASHRRGNWKTPAMHRSFQALFDVAEGLRCYVGLRHLSESTGAHALMSAVANAKCDLLKWATSTVCCPERHFANALAGRILADPNRAPEVQSAFCFFARSQRWRAFAKACAEDEAHDTSGPLARLLDEVEAATARQAAGEPALFFLASAFLKADVSAPLPVRVARAAPTLAKRTRCTITKRSAPFLRLVKRLLSDEAE
jgi:hypothetical protein